MPTVRLYSCYPTNIKPHAGRHWTSVWRRMTPNNDGIWNDIELVPTESDADWDVIVNSPGQFPTRAFDKKKTLLLQLEPSVVRNSGWGEYQNPEDLGLAATWTIRKHHFPLDWYLTATYSELVAAKPNKSKTLSACQTWKTRYPGHRLRVQFVEGHLCGLPSFDLYGNKLPVPHLRHIGMRCKDHTIFPYKYHFCSENSSEKHYFTEKIGDAWLGWSLPLYWGCSDLESFFPPESFIRLPLEKPKHALEIVEKAVRDGEWEKRLPAIAEARRLVLTKYQAWAVLETMLAEMAT